MDNVNPGLINPRLFIEVGYHFTSQLLLFGGTIIMNRPGFINPGLTLFVMNDVCSTMVETPWMIVFVTVCFALHADK